MGVRKSVHDEERSGLHSAVSCDLLQSERLRFTILELWRKFPQISRTLLCEIIIVLRKMCFEEAHRRSSMRLVPFFFLERYHKDGDEFLIAPCK
jgi:hypothetical protein